MEADTNPEELPIKKASELIAELERLIEKHGDNKVVIINDKYGFISDPVIDYSDDMFGYFKGQKGFRIY